MKCKKLLLPLLVVCLAACQSGPEGLHRTPEGVGPTIVFDLNARPLPEIPFPNDLATRPDPSAITGLRVNASQVAPTWLESRVRQKIDGIDGFGTLQPIAVSFDAPLDIDNLLRRHRDNLDFADDAVYLINLQPGDPDFGRPVLLDIGRGNYPLTITTNQGYFRSDAREQVENLVFDTTDEDLDGDGVLDPGEDTDDDGVLDHPNVWPPGADPMDGLMTFYESETNTLILQPVVPLKEGCLYAVVLTDRLRGRDTKAESGPVRSPFDWVHHLAQTDQLDHLHQVFEQWQDAGMPLGIDEVAFTWVFTTQSITADLVAIREGLHGVGPLRWLAREYPAYVRPLPCKNRDQDPPLYILESESLLAVLRTVGDELLGNFMQMAESIIESFVHVDYFATGWFESPDFLRTGQDGLDPENYHRENFVVDLSTGTAEHEPARISFLVALPKETERFKPPFPVVIYCHSYSSFGAEGLGFAGIMARRGMATIGINAWGHGIPADENLREIIVSAGHAYGFDPFAHSLLDGRARDLDGDGALDSGGDFWTGYGFHTRDVVRQSVVDHLQLVRLLLSFDGTKQWDVDQNGDGQPDLAGDFDGDGRVDLGGPDVPYYVWGQSGGGINSSIVAAMEPRIVAAAPTAGGGGLSGVSLRTRLGSVRRAGLLRIMGPLVVGQQSSQGRIRVTLIVPLGADDQEMLIDEVQGVSVGDRVVVTNLGTELMPKHEEHSAHVRSELRFRVSMKADNGDRFRVTFENSDGEKIAQVDRWSGDVHYLSGGEPTYLEGQELQTPTEGFGAARCTPDFRRLTNLFQMIIDPADPANYAPHYFLDPLDIRPEGKTVTNLLEVACVGDQDVPIQAQTTMGRAAGVIPHLEVDSRYGMPPNDWLIAHHVYEGLSRQGRYPDNDILFDPDDLDEGQDGFDAPTPTPSDRLRIKVQTPTGVSGIRFAYMHPHGMHGVFPTDSEYDIFMHFTNLIAHFFHTGGKEILDDTCLSTSSCEF